MAEPRNANLRAAAQANLIRPRYANGALVSPADVENLQVRFHEGTVSRGLIRCSPSYSLAPYASGRTQMFRNFIGVSVTADGSGPATPADPVRQGSPCAARPAHDPAPARRCGAASAGRVRSVSPARRTSALGKRCRSNLFKPCPLNDVQNQIRQVTQAFQAWSSIRNTEIAQVYLMSLLGGCGEKRQSQGKAETGKSKQVPPRA